MRGAEVPRIFIFDALHRGRLRTSKAVTTAFFSVFIAVLLAEFGDKTRIATALFAAGGDRPPWLVFLASASALVVSAALATLIGGALRELVSGPWLKLAAGAGFIVVGVWMLWSALRPA